MVRARLALETEAAREVGLGVQVDEQHALFGHGERGSQVDGGRGFANATLLIGDGDDPGWHLWLIDLKCTLCGRAGR